MKLFYKFVSYAFHPILFSFIGSFLYILLSPIHMVKRQEYIILTIIFISTYILPIFLLISLKKLKMITSYQLSTIEERKFPILFFIILSLMLAKMLLGIKIADLLAYSFFAISIALSATYILLFFRLKISLHTLGIGGILGFIMVMSIYYQLNLIGLICFLFLLSGLIAVSRLKLKAHKPNEVYIGFLIGLIAQLLSYQLFL